MTIRCVVFPLLLLLALPVRADWPQLRGPNADGHAPDAGLREAGPPVTWSETENVTWKVDVRGLGHSSPVVLGGRLWLTTADDGSLRALAFDTATGKKLHDVEVFRPAAFQDSHGDNSEASPTAVLEEGRAYVHFGAYGTAALRAADASVVWKFDDVVIDHEVGPGSSPILFEDLLIVHFDGTDRQFVAAFHKADGRPAWTSERHFEPGNKPPHMKAFSTPIVVEQDGQPRLISAGADQVAALDPRTGKKLWEVRYEGYSVVPMPVAGLGMVFVTTGYMKPELLAIRLDASSRYLGDVTETHVAWRYRWTVPANPSPLLVGERLFLMEDWGKATWLDARRGEDLWRERLGGRHWASPLLVDGRIYTWSEEGETVVLAPEDTFRVLARNKLDAVLHATPAVAEGAFFVRSTDHLYRIEEAGDD